MIVAIQGTKGFDDYQIFLRAIGTALRDLPEDDKEFILYSAGPMKINAFGQEFSNISERTLKSQGIKIKLVKVPPSWIDDNLNYIDYFAFFSKPKETWSKQAQHAHDKDANLWVYRY
jgi:hypothetical protein